MVATFVDWYKLPAGVLDPVTTDLEPRDDTLLNTLAWGSDAWSVDSLTSQTGYVDSFIGLIEWMGNSDVPPDASSPPGEVPLPSSYPQSEWIWWYKTGGAMNIPGNGLTTVSFETNDWQRRSSAKRKLPENMGILLVAQLVVDSVFEDTVTWFPDWMFRSIYAAGSHLKSRR